VIVILELILNIEIIVRYTMGGFGQQIVEVLVLFLRIVGLHKITIIEVLNQELGGVVYTVEIHMMIILSQ
jgi:hypothetical protein